MDREALVSRESERGAGERGGAVEVALVGGIGGREGRGGHDSREEGKAEKSGTAGAVEGDIVFVAA